MKGKAIFKQWLAAAVSGVMLFGAGAVLPETVRDAVTQEITAEAAAYSPRLTAPTADNANYFSGNIFYTSGYGMPNCTCYAYGRAKELLGHEPSLSHGNANQWYGYNINGGYYSYGSEPKLGAICCWSGGGAGHVAVVEGISGDTVTISQSSWGGTFFEVVNVSRYNMNSIQAGFQGYIYIGDWTDVPQGHVMSESEAAGQTIPDGDYWIASAMSYNYFLDVPGEEISGEGTNVLMQVNEGGMPSEYDVWTVTYLNNGFYQIRQKNGLPLDAHGGTIDEGLNANLWTKNDSEYGSNAQQWSISYEDNGYYIKARCNACCLDIEKALLEHGANVGTYFYNGGTNQAWCFIPYDPDERPLEDGVYRISSMHNTEYVLDASGVAADEAYTSNTNVQVWDTSGDDYFRIAYDKDGYYHIYEQVTGLALDVYNADVIYTTSNNIQLYDEGEAQRNQLWKIRDAGNGSYVLYSKLNGFVMDMAMPEGKEPENGTNVNAYMPKLTNNDNQQWQFTPYEEPSTFICDLNDDGETSILDLIALQKHILGANPFNKTQYSTADLDDNGTVDVFDLALLKRALLKQS